MHRSSRLAVCALALACSASAGLAQVSQIVTQWNFNSNPPDGSAATGTLAPNIGAGTAAVWNLTTSLFDGAVSPAPGSTDPNTADDSAWRVAGNWTNPTDPSGGRGVQFDVPTTNFNSIVISWDQRFSSTSSRYMQVFYSVDGTNFVAFPEHFAPAPGSTGDVWVQNITADLSLAPGVENNPNFRFRIAAVHSPTENQYVAASVLPADVFGMGGNTQRYDMVTVRGVPVNQTNPSGAGVSDPRAVCPSGGQVKLSVAVVGGLLPDSTGLTVSGDLTGIGGSAAQAFADDGQNGDVSAGDNIFTYVATVPSGVSVGSKVLPITIGDAQGRAGAASVTVEVADCAANSASRVVISQAFGGGGNLGPPAAAYQADFVELYNRSAQVVDLTGWSIQYAGQTAVGGFDNSDDQVLLSGSIKPGQYMLVQMGDPGLTGAPLPTADFVIKPGLGGHMGNNGGRVALVRSAALLGTDCGRADIEDFVGYGGAAICYEGAAPTGTPSNDTGVIRALNGVQDVNQNFHDFTVGVPTARNRATGGFLAGFAAISDAQACAGSPVTISVTVSPATAPTSTGVAVAANLTAVGGGASVALLDNGVGADQSAGDGVYTLAYTIPGATAQGLKSIGITTTDAQGRSDGASVALNVATCNNAASRVVISQVFGGGGNDGSIFNADFIEIFNRSGASVDLTGWSVQYADSAPATFTANRTIALSGSIGPGEHRLIVTNVPSLVNGVPVPTADFVPASTFGMDNQFARVALMRVTVPLGTACTSPNMEDFVGYGLTAGCFEGLSSTASLSNQLAAIRRDGGCRDNDQNGLDFEVTTPFDIPKSGASAATPCTAASVNCCRGTTCVVVTGGSCTGTVAGSASVAVGACSGTSFAGCCFGDYDHNGTKDITDIFTFLNAWFSASTYADITSNGASTPDITDIFTFLNAWFGSCN